MATLDRRSRALLALLVVLGVAYYLVELRGRPERDTLRAREAALFPVERGDVARIELSSGVTLARADGRFEIVAPVAAPADPEAAARLLEALLAVRCENRFAVPAESLAAFGLAEPRSWCAITTRAGSRRVVDVGAETPTGNHLYVRDRESGACCVVWGSLLRESKRRVDELRDRRLVAARAADVATLSLERAADTLVIVRDPSRWWRIVPGNAAHASPATPPSATSPGAVPDRRGRASTETIAALFERLANARVLGFADAADPESLRARAATTLRRAILTRSAADSSVSPSVEARAETLLVGFPEGPAGFPMAIRSPIQPRPANVDLDLVALLDVPVDSLFETRLLFAAPEQVRRLAIEREASRLALVRTDDGWSAVAPETLAADPVLVRALLRNLDNERIVAWRRDLSRAEAGLDSPRLRLRIAFDDVALEDEILVGDDAPGGVFAQFAGDSAVFVANAKLLEILPADVSRIEARQILAAPISTANSLTLAFAGDEPLELARRSDVWVDARGRLGSRAARVAGYVSALTPVDRVPLGEGAAALGFDHPMLVASWDGPRGGRLEIADALDPDRRFGRTSRATGVLYLFLQSDIDSLRHLVTR